MAPSLLTPTLHKEITHTAMPLSGQPFIYCNFPSTDPSLPTDIKLEPCSAFSTNQPPSLLSPPWSPHNIPRALARPSPRRRAYSDNPLSRSVRRVAALDSVNIMSDHHHHPYNTWNSSDNRANQSLSPPESYLTRRSSDGDEVNLPSGYSDNFASQNVIMSRRGRNSLRSDPRPPSAVSTPASSSLSGAVGPTRISGVAHTSGPPSTPSPSSDASLPGNNSPVQWMTRLNSSGSGHQLQPLTPSSMTSSSGDFAAAYADYSGQQSYMSTPPASGSPYTPSYPAPDGTMRLQQQQQQRMYGLNSQPRSSPMAPIPWSAPARTTETPTMYTQGAGFQAGASEEEMMQQITVLRARVRELEAFCQDRAAGGGTATYASGPLSASPQGSGSGGHLPSPLPSPVPSAAFRHSWRARTDARVKRFCAPNRAGNALCAWHDSRRERRAYPPRMAPAGYLNCGCTFEEALFEESLSRHGVGSYLPGEMVRMDPALRNPLLRLLQQRYGYQDGDFERDAGSGNWVEGEGPEFWEQALLAPSNPRSRRHEGSSR